MIRITKGLDLPMTGAPNQAISAGAVVKSVALNGMEYLGLKPRMLVNEGDMVEKGQPLFVHKQSLDVMYTAPATGKISAINRGAKRVLETIVIDIADDDNVETGGVSFDQYDDLSSVTLEQARSNLYKSGLWTSFRTRPYSKIPIQETVPHAIFVTAMESDPVSADAGVIINSNLDAFLAGLEILTKLGGEAVYLCQDGDQDYAGVSDVSGVSIKKFSGIHPAGLAGTHMHFVDPVSPTKTNWSINYQDVMAIGQLFKTGALDTTRVVALAGPQAANPRLIKTRMGASIVELTDGELKTTSATRLISGSVLSGAHAHDQFAYLGRYHRQITLMEEDKERVMLAWLIPSMKRFSFSNVQLSSFLRSKLKFAFTTNQNGSRRAMVPFGSYERVMPLDMLATPLLKSVLINDTDQAQALGALELDEEDLALSTFICHSKYEYGLALRECLIKIEKEG